MSEMVERAIEQVRPIMDDLLDDYTFTDSAIEKVVRGVIAAMFEPTEDMVEATRVYGEYGRIACNQVWPDMIAHALKVTDPAR